MANTNQVNLQKFKAELKQFGDETEDAITKVLQGTALEMSRRIILKTPVDTGRARGNWQAGINSQPNSQLPRTDKGGGGTISSVERETSRAKIKDKIYVLNNLPYIEVLEDGSSSQAPQGMVKTTVVEFESIVNTEAGKHR